MIAIVYIGMIFVGVLAMALAFKKWREVRHEEWYNYNDTKLLLTVGGLGIATVWAAFELWF